MKVELPRYQSFQPTGWEWLSELPTDWEALGLTRRIERIVDYRGATPEKVDDGTFLITAKNVRNGQIDYEISKEYVVTEKLETIMRRGKPKLGDLLLTMEAPLGEVANIDREDIALAQRLVKIRPKPKFFSPYFLKYWMMSVQFRQHIETHGTGSIAVGIKASKLHLLRVVQPARDVQDAIVTFLDRETAKIDRLMAVRQKQIERLQEQRTAVIHHAVTKGLNPKAKMKPSGVEWLGDVNAEWKLFDIKHLAEVVAGGTPKSTETDYWDGDVVWVTPTDFGNDGQRYITKSGRTITPKGQIAAGLEMLSEGAVVMSTRAPVGSLGILSVPATTNQGCKGIAFDKRMADPRYFFYLLSLEVPYLNAIAQGATFVELSGFQLKNLKVACPDAQIQGQIADWLDDEMKRFDDLFAKYQRELELLAEYRASLISHAVTGKIDVRGLVEPQSLEAA